MDKCADRKLTETTFLSCLNKTKTEAGVTEAIHLLGFISCECHKNCDKTAFGYESTPTPTATASGATAIQPIVGSTFAVLLGVLRML